MGNSDTLFIVVRKAFRRLLFILPAFVVAGGIWVAGDCTRFVRTDPLSESPTPSGYSTETQGENLQNDPVRNVLLVHGIFDTSNKFKYLGRRLEEHGFHIVVIDLKPSNASEGLDPLAGQIAELVESQFGDEPFALVGYSMGGLVSRAYLQKIVENKEQIVGFATISTPHHGSLWGWLHPSKGARQMRPGSQWMQDLNRNPDCIRELPFLSLWSPLDLMIVPSWSSRTDLGKESLHWVPAHPLMLFNPGVANRLADFLKKTYDHFERGSD